MGLLEVHTNPSRRELRVFAVLWFVFWGALGTVALFKPQALLGAALPLALAWGASLAFNAEQRRRQMLGVLPPMILGAMGSLGLAGRTGPALAIVGLAALPGALLIWLQPELGRKLYVGWMVAVTPAGWAVSSLVLVLIYYVVFTPIGLILRLAGRDPLRRRFDPRAQSYWVARSRRQGAATYFRQF